MPGSLRRDTVTEEVASERIEGLTQLAREAVQDGDEDRARRYVRRARRIAERNRLRLPRTFVRRTCDRCDVYLVPGANARVRLQDGHVVTTCDCGEHHRYPYDA
jgi:ribonuclease P protein subunit RPR2